jgi:TonB-dependent receptor
MTSLRIALSGSASLAAMFIAAPAWAQGAPDAADETEIIVTGSRPIAESEAAALEVQKNSDSLVTVAAADAVGRLPDQNIAQAASRLPGIGVERDQGQARYINLRGAPRTWTTLSIDGITVVSPEGRDTRYDSLPAALASQIVVAKAVTPDMTGETISGNVNIITRSPFDYKGFKLAAKLGGGVVELGNREEYEGSLVVSNVFETGIGDIGVLLSASYYQRNMITDNFETDWEGTRDGGVVQDRRPGFQTRFWARENENKLYRLTRKNYSYSGRLDWKPDGDNTISLRSLFTTFTDDEARDNYIFDFDDRQGDLVANTAACSTAPNLSPTTTGYADICIGNTPLRGSVYGIDINQRATLRAFEQSIFTNTLTGDHNFGDGWNFKWLGNYTRSRDDRSVVGEARYDSPATRNLRPTVLYDFTNKNLARVQLNNTIQLANPTRFIIGAPVVAIDNFTKPLSSFRVLDAVDTTDAYTGRLVLAKETGLFGGEGTIRLGVQYDQRTKSVDENQLILNSNVPAQAALLASAGIPSTYPDISLSIPFQGEIPLGYTFRYFDIKKVRQFSRSARGVAPLTAVDANFYNVREEVYAGYLMGNSKFDWGSIVGGARIEHVKNRGRAFATIGTAAPTPVTSQSDSTLVFPSLHVNYNVASDMKFRLGFTSGAARADYDQLRPNVLINDANQTISGGNPSAKPERAYGADAYMEWYVVPQGYVMVGAFYKRVEDVLYTQRRTFGSNALDSNGQDRSQYIFSGITNGGKGRIYGVEAAIQMQLEPFTADLGLPDWMGGFGISTNVTLNKSSVSKPEIRDPLNNSVIVIPERRVRLPGTSDVVYNLGAYYEKYGLSMRVQYQKRSKWVDALADDLTDAGDAYWAADDELDVSVRYAFNENFEIYFDASNLLNGPGRRFSDPGNILKALGFPGQGTDQYTIEQERFGRRYTGGIRVTF